MAPMVVLFDVDGTLIDHDSAETVAVSALHRRLRLDGTPDEFHIRWRAALERHYARFLAGEVSSEEQRRARLREIVDPGLSDAAADAIVAGYLDDYLANCRLYADVEPTLAKLSPYRLGVISNGEFGQQHSKLERNGIAERFTTMIMSADCGFAKPDAEIFRLACTRMDAPPSQAVYVGDRRDIDAEAARAAGLQPLVHDDARRDDVGADPLAPPAHHHVPLVHIRTLLDLPAMLEKIGRPL